MFKKHLILALSLSAIIGGCNPDCQNLTGVRIADFPLLTEQEVLIEAANPSALENRQVFFNDVLAETRMVPNVGLIATLPPNVMGSEVEMRIEDPDCEDFVRFGLNVVDEDFFAGNENFIPPAPPQIIIPSPNPPVPPSINNAWISPNNTDYCIWFAVKPVPGSTTSFVISADKVLDPISQDSIFSRELSVVELTNCTEQVVGSELYHENPVFGMIDTKANYIQFWIDRGELGIEEFEGQFISVDDTPYNDSRTPPDCGPPWGTQKKHMMMLTSKKTHRRLIMYQQLF